MIEHHSQAPLPEEVASALVKGAWSVEQWLRKRWKTRRSPLTLLLCVGRPAGALQRFALSGRSPGCYRGALGALEVLLVDVRGLPPGRGTSFLRALDHHPEVAAANLRALYEDPRVDQRIKIRIGEAVMREHTVFDPSERFLTAQELLEEGRKEGREEGRVQEARSNLRLLTARRLDSLSPKLEAAIQGCRDRRRMEEALLLLTEPLDPAALELALLAALQG